MATFLREPVPFEEAAEFIRSKPVVSREAFFKLLPELRGRAFLVSGLAAFDVAEDIRNAIAKIPQGAIWGDVREKIATDLLPYFVDPTADPETQLKQATAAARRAELLIRTHGFQAYQAANHEAMSRNIDVMPYWQYLTMDDARVRVSHAALNGIVLPAASPFWKTHFPPWDWNCRCQVVPLSEDDVADLRAVDSRRAPEDKRILGPEAQRVLETEERLVRGGRAWSVASPANKAPDAGGFRFDPEGLRISMDALKARYSPEVWKDFSAWAKTTSLGDGRSVWEWMSEEKRNVQQPTSNVQRPTKKVEPTPAPKPAPVAQPEPAPAPVRANPVSNALAVEVAHGKTAALVRETIALIDKVHDDGKLPRITLNDRVDNDALGVYVANNWGRATRIGVSSDGPWKRLTAAHEIGHFIDHQALDVPGMFASEKSEAMKKWRRAILKSAALAAIKAAPIGSYGKKYFTSKRECFARSYAQWIATRSGDAAMLAEVQKALNGLQPWRQWTAEDFEPIAKALDEVFASKGWMS